MEFEENLLQAVDIARQAPSSHNCQPWKLVHIEDRRMRAQLMPAHAWPEHGQLLLLGIDRKRTLRALPSLALEMQLSCGMFLGLLSAAFDALGFDCNWHWLDTLDTQAPAAMPFLQSLEQGHGCRGLVLLALQPQRVPDATALAGLQDSVRQRRTHRAPFAEGSCSDMVLAQLLERHWPEQLTGDQLHIRVERSPAFIARAADLVRQFAALDFSSYRAWKETYRYLHFDPRKPAEDGFYLHSLMGPMSPLRTRIMQCVLAPEVMQVLRIVRVPHKMAAQLAALVEDSAQLLSCSLPSDELASPVMVQAGARLMEVWLNAQRLGLALHPLSVMLQHDRARGELQRLAGGDRRIVFFARLGAIRQRHGECLRRPLAAIIATHGEAV
ncbi:nitroreductase family protein [Massilia rubra]|uniref:Nitroreductase n=1 Tax=Massilia rubra TaxID=2607910 RepID=A0ABX0M791_9BURK|nr:nitroreductase family protein [Massilia rubra]NHZ38061.1 hypothetical protein [Massilia rubra]